MKQIYFFSILICFTLNIDAQNVFETEITDAVTFDAIQNCNGEFILYGNTNPPRSNYQNGMFDHSGVLIKLSETGKLLLKKDTSITDSCYVHIGIDTLSNGNYLCCSQIFKNYEEGNNIIVFSEYDNNFNVIRKKKHIFPKTTHNIYRAKLQNTGNEFILSGETRKYLGEQEPLISFYYKFDSNFDSLMYVENQTTQLSDLADNSSSHFYTTHLFYTDTIEAISADGVILKIKKSDFSVDTVFDMSTTENYVRIFPFDYSYIKFMNDSTFIFYAPVIKSFSEEIMTYISVMDTSFNTLHYNFAGFNNYQNFSAFRNGISLLNQDYIFTGSQTDDGIGLALTKYNTELNLEWEKFYYPENSNGLYSVLATRDNGCLMVVRKKVNGEYSTLALKVDENGSLTHIDGKPTDSKTTEQIIYPNPGMSELNIRTAIQRLGGKFTMYDISGKLVFQKLIYESTEKINTNNLPKGNYIYNYIYENEIIESGKWSKK